jgi:hypothetical protein
VVTDRVTIQVCVVADGRAIHALRQRRCHIRWCGAWPATVAPPCIIVQTAVGLVDAIQHERLRVHLGWLEAADELDCGVEKARLTVAGVKRPCAGLVWRARRADALVSSVVFARRATEALRLRLRQCGSRWTVELHLRNSVEQLEVVRGSKKPAVWILQHTRSTESDNGVQQASTLKLTAKSQHLLVLVEAKRANQQRPLASGCKS